MATGDPSLLGKNSAVFFLLILGLVLIAIGVSTESTGLVVFGTLVLVAGLILMVLKIMRRNESAPISSPRAPLHHSDIE